MHTHLRLEEPNDVNDRRLAFIIDQVIRSLDSLQDNLANTCNVLPITSSTSCGTALCSPINSSNFCLRKSDKSLPTK